MTDRAVRSLEHLERSASTARVLNLLRVARDHGDTDEWRDQPLFFTPQLNTALIIKHRIRRNEIDLFPGRRQVATKVILPIDRRDLRTGGRYLFVDQVHFEQTLRQVFGIEADHPDVRALRLIDELPSLDPFLLREKLRRAELEPAPCYFALSEGDLDRMLEFVKTEITPLVTLSLGAAHTSPAAVEKMAAKILSNASTDRMDVLGATLRLSPDQYEEGIFCWKGFLYYKWCLDALMDGISAVEREVGAVRPVGALDAPSREYLDRSRDVLSTQILLTCARARGTLRVYDKAYGNLTGNGDPLAFRDFLLEAPKLFARLGDQLGAIQHIVSFWTFRFGPHAVPPSVEELIDIFMDFETGLRGRGDEAPAPAGLAA
jgi:hypothetical protein